MNTVSKFHLFEKLCLKQLNSILKDIDSNLCLIEIVGNGTILTLIYFITSIHGIYEMMYM